METSDLIMQTMDWFKFIPLILLACGNLTLRHKGLGMISIGAPEKNDDVCFSFKFPSKRPVIDITY